MRVEVSGVPAVGVRDDSDGEMDNYCLMPQAAQAR